MALRIQWAVTSGATDFVTAAITFKKKSDASKLCPLALRHSASKPVSHEDLAAGLVNVSAALVVITAALEGDVTIGGERPFGNEAATSAVDIFVKGCRQATQIRGHTAADASAGYHELHNAYVRTNIQPLYTGLLTYVPLPTRQCPTNYRSALQGGLRTRGKALAHWNRNGRM